jgi:hypothetical protein
MKRVMRFRHALVGLPTSANMRPAGLRFRRGIRIAAANMLASAAFALLALFPAIAAAAPNTYELDLYNSQGVLYQDPDTTACAAAAAQMMLNMATYQANLSFLSSNEVFQLPMRWRIDTSAAKKAAILAYSRANMTMLTSSLGTDPHGWRNALNLRVAPFAPSRSWRTSPQR